MNPPLQPIRWESNRLFLLDQRALPREKRTLCLSTMEETIQAIRDMAVRGAPAIAISGIFGLALGTQGKTGRASASDLEMIWSQMKESRPTAVNLSFALKLAWDSISRNGLVDWESIHIMLIKLGQQLMEEDFASNVSLGKNGVTLFPRSKKELNVITHCNTGALATAGHGTALGVVRSLRDSGFQVTVYADETRPFLQGSRLTAFEMKEEGIPCYIITDGMSGWLMANKEIDAVIVGCDRVAANGDTANKIGTYTLALAAKAHNVPFYVCATKDSFDLSLSSGKNIPIEFRTPTEVTEFSFLKGDNGLSLFPPGFTSPVGAQALNPSFDVTPAGLVSRFITEFGVFLPEEIPERLKSKE